MKYNYLPDIKKAINSNNDEIMDLFYVVHDDVIVNTTELSNIIDLCQAYEVPFGFTMYDLISGKVDSDIIKMLEIKLWLDQDVANLPTTSKKKNNKSNNKIVQFNKNKNNKDNN